jgi:hypothetical protein
MCSFSNKMHAIDFICDLTFEFDSLCRYLRFHDSLSFHGLGHLSFYKKAHASIYYKSVMLNYPVTSDYCTNRITFFV